MNATGRAKHFIEQEKEFQLGFLPTEQSNPLTRTLSDTFQKDTAAGIRLLQLVDRNVLTMARRVLAGDAFEKLVIAGETALRKKRRIVFSGCGATGRLSILLEAMWRGSGNSRVFSIMTGGDYALIRSVESFEDYASFGRRQVQDFGLEADDVLVAITEGGETSSVLGTVDEAARRGARVFLMFNNPADILRQHLERCRQALDNPAVTALDLSCGPMAVAGSTRMQATTAEQLIAGAALEQIHARLAGLPPPPSLAAADAFEKLLEELAQDSCISELVAQIEFEESLYRKQGLVTYFADRFLLDIFTDTTERSPTFMTPPFRKNDDLVSPQSWAFVKNPLFDTPQTWHRCLAREPRCLKWTGKDYAQLGADELLVANPPKLDNQELMKFIIGYEKMPCRERHIPNAAVLIGSEQTLLAAFQQRTAHFQTKRHLQVPINPSFSPLSLMTRLGIKLALNTISTGTMARLGRISGNWMSYVDVSNKKLMDRATRLVADLTGVDYATACTAIFRVLDMQNETPTDVVRESPVQLAMRLMNREV